MKEALAAIDKRIRRSKLETARNTTAFLLAIVVLGASSAAQTSAPPTTAPAATNQSSQAQADTEWLTAYMLAHNGYRLDHMPALEASFSKMTPTQLHTLRDFYQQKHALIMQQQANINRFNAQQVAMAEAYQQRQQRSLDTINQEQTQAANQLDQQINQMHQEAAANAAANRMSYPGQFGPYGSPYGYGGYGFRPQLIPSYPY